MGPPPGKDFPLGRNKVFLEMHPFQEVREALSPEVGLSVHGSEAVRRGFRADSGLGVWCPAQGPRWGWGGVCGNWVPGFFPGPAEDLGVHPLQVSGLTAKRLLRTGVTPDSLDRAS